MQSTDSPQYQQLLQQHQLASFDQLWDYQGDWFESPNHERGGWSGVNYIELADEAGHKHGFYLKRQQAHTRRTWRHPISGEPTFVREFEILEYLNKHHVATPKLVFFGNQQDKAVLLTEALTGFTDAEMWLKTHADLSIKRQRKLMRALATTVRKLHQAGVQHRSLYLKHLFVRELNGVFEVATIDFEKSRVTKLISWLRFSDLITLHSRTASISASNKLVFFKQYFRVENLTALYKFLCRYMHQQSIQKRR